MAADADSTGQLSEGPEYATRQAVTRMRVPVAAGLVFVVALVGLLGWLGYQAHDAQRAQQQRDVFLQVARQTAVNLTTINDTDADADVQRILASATGTFHDQFQQRAPAFIEAVKKSASKTQGNVTAAALESEEAGHARVLVAVSVKTTNATAPEQPPHVWRVRIGMQKVGDGAKVSDVAFVQ